MAENTIVLPRCSTLCRRRRKLWPINEPSRPGSFLTILHSTSAAKIPATQRSRCTVAVRQVPPSASVALPSY